MKLPFSL